jgi:hypothetical protein
MPVQVKGALALRKALKDFTPDLAKQTRIEIAEALKPVVKVARGYFPNDSSVLSNWKPRASQDARFPTYTASIVKRGVGFKSTPSKVNSKGFRSLASLSNKTAAGAIYETAGRKTSNSTFVKNITGKASDSKFKGSREMEGRALYRAYEENQGKAQDGVIKAIEKAALNLNKRASVRA